MARTTKVGKRVVHQFQERPDGTYCLCRSCAEKGYGEDSFHPATEEFWGVVKGRMQFGRCYACRVEYDAARRGCRHGFLPEDIELAPRTIPYGRCDGNDPIVHALVAA